MIQDRVDQLKETKMNISEFSRISNQIRVKQVVQFNQAKQDAMKQPKYSIVWLIRAICGIEVFFLF